jgi:hypothetical protein
VVRFPGVIYRRIAEKNAWLEIDLVWMPENEEAVVGRFVAFMRDEARSRGLVCAFQAIMITVSRPS